MRISRQQMFMLMAEAAARRSTCFRLNVGAVLVYENNVISIGYNGPPSGHPHCAGNDCPGRFKCNLSIHAEKNAIDRANVTHPRRMDMYVTDSPCDQCADLIIEHSIKRVFFRTPYRITEPLKKIGMHGIGVYRVNPVGSVMEWFTGEFVNVDKT